MVSTPEICLRRGKAKTLKRGSIDTLLNHVVVESSIRSLPSPRYGHVGESQSTYVQFQYRSAVLKICSPWNSESHAVGIAHCCIKGRAAKKHDVRGGCDQRSLSTIDNE